MAWYGMVPILIYVHTHRKRKGKWKWKGSFIRGLKRGEGGVAIHASNGNGHKK